jgi:hypothetical protein
MSESSISEADGADTDGRVEQAIRFRANQLAARAPSPAQARQHPEQELRNRRGTYRDECCRDWNHSSRICFAENVHDQLGAVADHRC